MNTVWLVLFDLFVVWFFFGQTLQRWLSPPRLRLSLGLREIERHFRHRWHRDRDLLAHRQNGDIMAMAEALRTARQGRAGDGLTPAAATALSAQPVLAGFVAAVAKDGYAVAATALVDSLQAGEIGPQLTVKKRAWLRDHLEIAVVALGLAFGVRALFLQPFKIPTGSMQPTLYGIHFIHSEEGAPKFGPVGRFFGYLHYSRRYADLTAQEAGWLDLNRDHILPVRHALPLQNWLLPESSVRIGSVAYVLPGARDDVFKYLYAVAEDRARRLGPDRALQFAKGELVLRGHLELGDHLFVDRTYLPFHEPARGNVTVFRTDNIVDTGGNRLKGPYYVKRLVGMPGDELRIRDHHLQVRRPGETEFRPLDASDHPAFGRIYSGLGGYRGHSHLGDFCLTNEDDVFYIPRQGDLLRVEPQTRSFSIQKVDADTFEPYRPEGLALPIQQTGVPSTLAWLDGCGWFDRVEEDVYRFRYDHYLMMGDNTEGSSDGRSWGTVPRANLVGRASWVWWPFTRRWGRADRLAPLDYPSPPGRFGLPPLGADASE